MAEKVPPAKAKWSLLTIGLSLLLLIAGWATSFHSHSSSGSDHPGSCLLCQFAKADYETPVPNVAAAPRCLTRILNLTLFIAAPAADEFSLLPGSRAPPLI